jgi:cobalt-zinc-cadmium resistance protein CzcA
MLNRLILFAIQQRLFILLFILFLIGGGVYSFYNLPIDAFPDPTPPQVQIFTQTPGLAPEEVERLVTYPIEVEMNGLPDLVEVRSLSPFGLSWITVVFKDHVNIYFARQLVLERLQQASGHLPEGIEPEMGPITTGLGRMLHYIVKGDGFNNMELRTIQDWLIKPQMRTVPGVSEVVSMGGDAKQYEVLAHPDSLFKYNLTLNQVFEALQKNNLNAGGNLIEKGAEEYLVRGVGLVRSAEDIGNIIIATHDGIPIYVKNVAEVTIGSEFRRGATVDGDRGEVVEGIILKLKGENTKKVIERIKERIKVINASLPKGVTIQPYYDQLELVNLVLGTVKNALVEGAVLVVIVLFIFLAEIRSALIVAISIPLSILFAFIMMQWMGLSANLMSLGGLAIGIGMMVDGSVVMVENIYRHLSEERDPKRLIQTILRAAQEVGRPIAFGIFIIIAVFLPIFTLQGVEGIMFAPLAFTISFALLGSLILALTLAPVLCSLFLKGKLREKESPVVQFFKKMYLPLLRRTLEYRKSVVITASALVVGSLLLLPFFGTEFLPTLEEGWLEVRATLLRSTSLTESVILAQKLNKIIMSFPEVGTVVNEVGRPEAGTDPEPVTNHEIMIKLKPQKEWTTAKSTEDLIVKMNERLHQFPGVGFEVSRPIANHINELLSGVRAQVAIKIFGEDLDLLIQKAQEISDTIATIPGMVDLKTEQVRGQPQLSIIMDRNKIARYGINVSDIQEMIETGIGGKVATEVFEGQRRFGVLVRLPKESRENTDVIKNLLVSGSNGEKIPLAQLANFEEEEDAPAQIGRENALRRIIITFNIRGRDMGSVVNDAQERVQKQIALPEGYFIEWGGQFQLQQAANHRFAIVVPLTVLMIFLLLYRAFDSLKNALLIITNIPFALVGGIVALFLSGLYLSVSASVGFIVLFGVAVLNGVVMVSYFNKLRHEGMGIDEAILKGAELRLRPVLMTAMVAALGLVPMLLSTGPGSEIQRPLATVVIGGLVSSTLLTLLVLPVMYRWFERRSIDQSEEDVGKSTADQNRESLVSQVKES